MYDQNNGIIYNSLFDFTQSVLIRSKFYLEFRLVLGRAENEKINWFLAEYQKYRNDHSLLIKEEIIHLKYTVLEKAEGIINGNSLQLINKVFNIETNGEEGWAYCVWVCDNDAIIPCAISLIFVDNNRTIQIR